MKLFHQVKKNIADHYIELREVGNTIDASNRKNDTKKFNKRNFTFP